MRTIMTRAAVFGGFCYKTGMRHYLAHLLLAGVVSMVASVGLCWAADEPATFEVWPGKAPGKTSDKPPEKLEKKEIEIVSNVSRPTLTIFRPEKDKDIGA